MLMAFLKGGFFHQQYCPEGLCKATGLGQSRCGLKFRYMRTQLASAVTNGRYRN